MRLSEYGQLDSKIRRKIMIKITGYSLEETKYSVSYNRSARVLDIESSPMSDDYTPHDESTGCMLAE